MKTSIIPREDLPFVQTVKRIMYCNPFLPERTELEEAALGPAYTATDHPWNIFMTEPSQDANLSLLLERVAATADACRANLERRPPASEHESELYFNLVWFHLYYRHRGLLDRFVRDAHVTGTAGRNVPFFAKTNADAESYLGAGGHAVQWPYPYTHMFAFGFQVRRAFHHIFRFILGTSTTATRLRARVWQSIFTHDIERYLRSLIPRMGDIITLVTGPSGSGKELVARAIALSRFIPFDAAKGCFEQDFMASFYPLNLSALSPTLIESELFGHNKGAFTGALADHEGYLETCGSCGTVFLDEIGEVAPEIQVKLLRVLQTRSFRRLGDTHTRPFLGQLVAATNRDLQRAIHEGEMREDFFYRLCADRIETPPLREILSGDGEEMHYLVHYIASKVAGEEEADGLTREVCDWIAANLGSDYTWPGNFRELEQCVRSILVHSEYHAECLRPLPSFAEQLDAAQWTAAEVLRQYATRVYAKTRNYEQTARILELDSRTVKKYIDRGLLDELSSGVNPR